MDWELPAGTLRRPQFQYQEHVLSRVRCPARRKSRPYYQLDLPSGSLALGAQTFDQFSSSIEIVSPTNESDDDTEHSQRIGIFLTSSHDKQHFRTVRLIVALLSGLQSWLALKCFTNTSA